VAAGGLPRLPRTVLHRPRLEAVLDAWLPLTLVRGMAGYGKTALVTSWLEQQDPLLIRPLVVTVQAGASIASLETELLSALGREGEEEADRGGPPHGLDELERSIKGLARDQRLVIVLEDGHYLTDMSWLRGLVGLLRRHRQLHVVLCAWGSHPLIDLAAGRVEFQEISPQDLLLTKAEIAELATLAGKERDDREYERLHAEFGGWFAPTSLALSAGPSQQEGDHQARRFIDLNLVPALDEFGCRELAFRLTLATRLDDALLQDLGRSTDGDVLALERSGVLHRSNEYDSYRFTAGVRDALRQVFETEDPSGVLATHRWLGEWYRRRADAEDDSAEALIAFRHALLGRDWDGAHHVWVRFESRFSMRHPEDYFAALKVIPERVLETRVAWSVARTAMATVAASLDRGWEIGIAVILAHLQAADEVPLQPQKLPLHDLLYLGAYRAAHRRLQGYRAADEYAASLHKIVVRRLRHGEFAGDRLGFFLVQRWLDKTMLGDEFSAMRFAIDASRLPLHSTSPHHIAQAGAAVAHAFALRGDRERARAGLELHKKWAVPGTWGFTMIASPARFAEGLLALDDLDAATARDVLDRLGEGHGAEPIWPFISYLHTQYDLHFGDRQSALDRATNARPVGATDHRVSTPEMGAMFDDATNPILLIARAEALISLGRAQQARHLLHGADVTHPAVATAMALAELAMGEYGAARIAITGIGRRSTNPRQRLQLLLLDAAAALHLEDHGAVRTRLRQLNGMYPSTRIPRAFTRIPSPLTSQLIDQIIPAEDRGAVHDARMVFPHGQASIALTPRERTLVESLYQGRSRQQTAHDLYLTLNTVKSQYSDLYRKLGVNSKDQALLEVSTLGLLD
jgi:LuxR family maltose regulon positive regulatory protein